MLKKSYAIKVPKELIDDASEAQVLKEVKDILVRAKACFYRIEGSGKAMKGSFIPSESKGLPDILVFKESSSYGLELKKRKKGATLSGYQADVISRMNATGNHAGVVFSAKGAIKMLTNQPHDSVVESDYGLIPVYY